MKTTKKNHFQIEKWASISTTEGWSTSQRTMFGGVVALRYQHQGVPQLPQT